jgi:hypothetical protein
MFACPIIFEYIKYKRSDSKTNKIKFWKNFLDKYGLMEFTCKTVFYGILLSFAIFALNIILVTLFSYFGINDLQASSKIMGDMLVYPIIFSLFLLISAIAEEFFFRAFLTTYTGIWFATIVFALMHFSYGSYSQIVGALILGLLLAIIWKKTKNFYIIAIGHFLQNLYSIILILMSLH